MGLEDRRRTSRPARAATASRLRAISAAAAAIALSSRSSSSLDGIARDEPPRDAKSLVVHHQRFADGHARRNGNPCSFCMRQFLCALQRHSVAGGRQSSRGHIVEVARRSQSTARNPRARFGNASAPGAAMVVFSSTAASQGNLAEAEHDSSASLGAASSVVFRAKLPAGRSNAQALMRIRRRSARLSMVAGYS